MQEIKTVFFMQKYITRDKLLNEVEVHLIINIIALGSLVDANMVTNVNGQTLILLN